MIRRHQQFDRLRKRSGSSLVEVIVVMTVTSMMFTIVVAMLHLILGAERNTSKELRESLLLARVAEQFRRDVHAATDSRLISKRPAQTAGRLVLTLPDGKTVDYQHDAGRLTRTVTESGRQGQRDRFFFRDGSSIQFVREPQSHLIAITIVRPRRENSPAGLQATVSATDRTQRTIAVTKNNPQQPVAAPKPSAGHPPVIRDRASRDAPSPWQAIRFEAILGRDHRFQKPSTK